MVNRFQSVSLFLHIKHLPTLHPHPPHPHHINPSSLISPFLFLCQLLVLQRKCNQLDCSAALTVNRLFAGCLLTNFSVTWTSDHIDMCFYAALQLWPEITSSCKTSNLQLWAKRRHWSKIWIIQSAARLSNQQAAGTSPPPFPSLAWSFRVSLTEQLNVKTSSSAAASTSSKNRTNINSAAAKQSSTGVDWWAGARCHDNGECSPEDDGKCFCVDFDSAKRNLEGDEENHLQQTSPKQDQRCGESLRFINSLI